MAEYLPVVTPGKLTKETQENLEKTHVLDRSKLGRQLLVHVALRSAVQRDLLTRLTVALTCKLTQGTRGVGLLCWTQL